MMSLALSGGRRGIYSALMMDLNNESILQIAMRLHNINMHTQGTAVVSRRFYLDKSNIQEHEDGSSSPADQDSDDGQSVGLPYIDLSQAERAFALSRRPLSKKTMKDIKPKWGTLVRTH